MNQRRWEQILPGLFRWQSGLSGPHQPVNSYAWKSPAGWVLVDPAADAPAVDSSGVTALVVTHVQEENAAGCWNFPGVPFHVPAGDEYLCRGRAAYEALITRWSPPWDWESRGNYQGHVAGARNERPLPAAVTLADSLRPGAELHGASILSTPGHGKHAVTILATIAGQRVAFCGDLVCGDGQLWNWFDSEWDYGLESGPRALRDSAQRLRALAPDLLCPTHGPVIREPAAALTRLVGRLETILAPANATMHPDVDAAPGPAPGFRQLLPGLHQYTVNAGNCAVLVSAGGGALLVDDGLCSWKPLPERAAHHREVMIAMKQALGIRRIEWIIPTHYHGDHLENIPETVAMDQAEVVCLDTVAEVIEHPQRFNLCCPLPWYGTNYDAVKVDRRIASGTRLTWHEYELEVFHLGGQTYYHAGVATTVRGQRVVFVGDSFGMPAAVCEPVLCYNDTEPVTRGWLYALDRIRERQPDLLVCGHGGAVRDPGALLENKRAAWQQRVRDYQALNAHASLREFFDPFVATGR